MNIAAALLAQGELAVVFLLILLLVAIVGAVLFTVIFGSAVRRNPNRPGSEEESRRHEGEERNGGYGE